MNLGHHDDSFDARNLYLHLILGALSYGRRLEACVARPSEHPPAPVDDDLLDAALGLVALARDVRARCDEAAREAPTAAPAEPTVTRARVPLR
jgi:hypothetical protein